MTQWNMASVADGAKLRTRGVSLSTGNRGSAQGERAKGLMTRLTCGVVAALLVLAGVTPAQAQSGRPDPKAEPWTGSRLQLGPLFFNPTFQLRNIGIDDNVFNDADFPRQDLTGTLGMDSIIGVRARALIVTLTQATSYTWYRRYRSERSVDGGLKVVSELRLTNFRPWFVWERAETHERGGFEIDARAGRETPNWSTGADFTFGRLGLSAGFSRTRLRYAEGESFEDVDLKVALDHRTEQLGGAVRYALSDTLSLDATADWAKERYDFSPIRDKDTMSYSLALSSSSEASVQLSARAGWKDQQFNDPATEGFRGVVGNGSVSFLPSEWMRLTLEGSRDVGVSFETEFPYYLQQGGRAEALVRFSEFFDLTFRGEGQWLKYSKDRTGTELPRQDRTAVLGAEFGYYLGGESGTRIGLRYEYAERVSPIARRNYARNRVYSDFRLRF